MLTVNELWTRFPGEYNGSDLPGFFGPLRE